MNNIIQTAEHLYASTAKELVAAYRFIQSKVIPALKDIDADASVIEAVTGLVAPEAVAVERAAFAVLGMVVDILDKVPETNGGVNITLDAEIVTEIKAIAAIIKKNLPHPVIPPPSK